MHITEVNLEALELKYGRLSVRRPVAERTLLASLGDVGQQSPVIAVPAPHHGHYIVIDGHKRVRALTTLKADVAKVTVWELGEAEALAASYRLSVQGGGRNAFEEGWLVAELHREALWPLNQVATQLGRSTSWVSKRLALVEELPEWMADAVASGQIGTHAAATYLVPLTRVNKTHGAQLGSRLRALGLTNRQWEALYAYYRAAGPEGRQKLVDDPALFFRAKAAAEGAHGLTSPQHRCLKSLDLIGSVALGLVRTLPEAVSGQERANQTLGVAWRRCRDRFDLLVKTAAACWTSEA